MSSANGYMGANDFQDFGPIHPVYLLRNFLLRNMVAKIEFLIHLIPVAHWPNTFLTVPDFWIYLQQVGELELSPCFTSSTPHMPNCRLFQGGEANQIWKKKHKRLEQATFSFAAQLHSNDFGTL